MEKTLDIRYLRDITHLTQTSKGDWVDLRAGEDVDLKKGKVAIIPLGFAIMTLVMTKMFGVELMV